jgi:hypothetical protein
LPGLQAIHSYKKAAEEMEIVRKKKSAGEKGRRRN